MQRSRTYSRQVATVLLLFLGYLAYDDKVESLKVLAVPFTGFALFAFGFKQEAVLEWTKKNSVTRVER